MTVKRQIFVGQLCDSAINNAQVLNARALLSRFSNPNIEWVVPYFDKPDPKLVVRKNIRLVKLWRTRLWQFHKFLLYQMNLGAIFYPNAYWFDDLALQLRKLTARRVPVITTLEGLVGNEERERQLSEWTGHAVYCQHVPESLLRRIDRVHSDADHIIAISPFLAKMGRNLYGDKLLTLPLGIDTTIFCPAELKTHKRFKIMGAGRMYANKRPGLFLDLAESFPQTDFVWFGEGELSDNLLADKDRRKLTNISFPGVISHDKLADEMRTADLFILPSLAEGSPKAVQEAAACGLSVIIYGYYEAPTVIDGQNGYVIWNEAELFSRVSELVNAPDKALQMGEAGAKMALEWDWDAIAPRWEKEIMKCIPG